MNTDTTMRPPKPRPHWKAKCKLAEAEAIFYRTQAYDAAKRFNRDRVIFGASGGIIFALGLAIGAWML